MNKDKKILFSWKRIIAVFMLFTMLAASIAGVSQYFGPVAVRAESSRHGTCEFRCFRAACAYTA